MKKKIFLFLVLSNAFTLMGIAQSAVKEFDTIQFNRQLEFANQLIENEYYTQLTIDKFSQQEDVSAIEWFSYNENTAWYTVGGNTVDNKFNIIHHVKFDSLYSISDYKGSYDTSELNAKGIALSKANIQFQIIRDTTSIYFNSFVISNPDQTISIWKLPAFQPSGQAIYGYEWEYIFDKTGKNLLRQNSYTNILTGVWIGQPRELWLNYRNTDKPTPGSVFFAQSFRDYFTRIRIDTRNSTSTVTKDTNGNYVWTHKIK